MNDDFSLYLTQDDFNDIDNIEDIKEDAHSLVRKSKVLHFSNASVKHAIRLCDLSDSVMDMSDEEIASSLHIK